MKQTKRVMIDLETLGRAAGCKILSIGAVVFDEDTGLHEEFYVRVLREGQHGLVEDPDTVKWWSEQSEEARTAAFDAPGGVVLDIALMHFTTWVRSLGADIELWGNGANFDNPILSTAYTACDLPQPWKFWNDRCYRTLKCLFPSVALDRQGTYHHALDDAKSQAEHAVRILAHVDSLGTSAS